MLLILAVSIFYIEHIQCANILGVFPFPSFSHQSLYQSICRQLSLRGHTVTVVTPDPLDDPSLTNLTEIHANNVYKLWTETSIEDILSKETNAFLNLHLSYSFAEDAVEATFSNEYFQKFINDKSKTFDLILLEAFPPTVYAIGGRFKAPIMCINPVGGITVMYNIFGSSNHPILYPDNYLSFHNQQMSLWDKVTSLLFSIWALYYYYYSLTPSSQKKADKLFGKNSPKLSEIETNMSMAFLNVDPSIYPRRPNSPTLIELHQLHLKPAKPLPPDLQEVLDEAKEGVVYFNLGTNIKSAQLKPSLKRTIIEALAELPYRIFWKYESNHLSNKPSNVIIRKWFPQQDILAHPNIRAFVTQGGLLSITESIFNAVPMIGLPFIGDQPMNVKKMVGSGIAIGLDHVTVTKDELKKSIIEVSENVIYKERIKEVSRRVYDKPLKGVEEAVWWSEYIIRHKGAKYLRSLNADISWFYYLLMDVFVIFLILVTFVNVIIYKLCQLTKFMILLL